MSYLGTLGGGKFIIPGGGPLGGGLPNGLWGGGGSGPPCTAAGVGGGNRGNIAGWLGGGPPGGPLKCGGGSAAPGEGPPTIIIKILKNWPTI